MSDWIFFRRCDTCGAAQTLRRLACQACGSTALSSHAASGGGTVYAITIVHRAADDAFRALAPYAVALADMDEGFRLMGMADTALAIGDRVSARRTPIAGRDIVHFARGQGQ